MISIQPIDDIFETIGEKVANRKIYIEVFGIQNVTWKSFLNISTDFVTRLTSHTMLKFWGSSPIDP